MNIEIANRLVKLRKEKGLSQEALAGELGIYRQAVSKWERAEASPDTDNLITLAKLYGMSLDDLLMSDQEKFESEQPIEEDNNETQEEIPHDEVNITNEGLHVKDADGAEVHIGWNGIHVRDGEDVIHVDRHGVTFDDEDYEYYHKGSFPLAAIICILYILIGVFYNMWHPGWLIFLFIPILDSLYKSIKKKNPKKFAYPVLALLIFLYTGFEYNMWHPMWVIFLTVPVYSSIAKYFKHVIKRRQYHKEQAKEAD